jgi:hypothetical protein
MLTWLTLALALECGAVTQNNWYLYNVGAAEITPQDLYITVEPEVRLFGWLFVGGAVRTDMQMTEPTAYRPFWTSYTFNAGVRFDALEAGFRHMCTHPVQTYIDKNGIHAPLAEGAYSEVYLRIVGEW